MEVALTISADGEDTVEVYRARKCLSRAGDNAPVLSAEIDLGPWREKIVRMDLEGELNRRWSVSKSSGYVAWSAELADPSGEEPIQFIGWQNDGSKGFHLGTVGSPAFLAPGRASEPFFYSPAGSLWHVLRVPEKAVLRVAVAPVPADSVGDDPKPFVPNTQPMKLPLGPSSEPASAQRPDVFIYLIDALRADHLGCYGYSRETSPMIDGFAADATLFERAYTAATWTRPSVATLLSGLYPSVHQAMQDPDKLDEWPVLLPEILQEAGYATCSVITNAQVSGSYGFNQGYDEFVFRNTETARWVNLQAARFLARYDPHQPVFMYLHTLEPHDPYSPSASSRRRFDRQFKGSCDGSSEALRAAGDLYPRLLAEDVEHLVDLYDAEILDVDRAFGEFLDLLRAKGRLENALIVLLADHGEGFTEHDTIRHGHNVNREEAHVPLIIRFPGGRLEGRRVTQAVGLIDVFPTVLGCAGIWPELEYAVAGVDLATASSVSDGGHSRKLYCELARRASNELDLLSVVDEDGFKRVLDMSVVPGAKATERSVGLWNTLVDPDEQEDLTEFLPVRAAYHEQLLARWLVEQREWRGADSAAGPPAVEMTDELRQNLRALGYLD
jgi:arylsulfatase A-like enzyme